MFDLSLAIAHHLLAFTLFGILVSELILVRADIDRRAIVAAARIDLWYGIVAATLVIVGFVRAVFAAKGWAYYEHNTYFWSKIATFVGVALLSVAPTIRYISWQRREQLPGAADVRFVQRMLWAQIALFALLPIFAAAMARGFGEAAS